MKRFGLTFLYNTESGACVVECSTETVMADECYGWKLDKWFKNQNTTEVAFKLSFVWRQEHLNCAYFIACTCISEKNLVVAEHYRISVKNCIFFHHYIFILNFHTSCTLHHISIFNMQLYKDVHGCTPSYAKSSAAKVHYMYFISFSNHSSSLGFTRWSKGLLCIHWFDWIIELVYLQIEKKIKYFLVA